MRSGPTSACSSWARTSARWAARWASRRGSSTSSGRSESGSLLRASDAVPDQGRGSGRARADPARAGEDPPRGRGRHGCCHRPARSRGSRGGRGRGAGGNLGRGRRPADAAAARRGDDSRVRAEDDSLRHGARSGDKRRLRSRARSRRAARRLRLARCADRAGRGEVRAAPVRARARAVGGSARCGRARRGPANGRARLDMAVEVKLPRLGQGMEAGTIVRWLKSEGENVVKGDPLYELDTDKVTQEVEAEADGVLLKIVVSDGEVDVGKTIAVIGEAGEEIAEAYGEGDDEQTGAAESDDAD